MKCKPVRQTASLETLVRKSAVPLRTALTTDLLNILVKKKKKTTMHLDWVIKKGHVIQSHVSEQSKNL